jgi:hypothetical protein
MSIMFIDVCDPKRNLISSNKVTLKKIVIILNNLIVNCNSIRTSNEASDICSIDHDKSIKVHIFLIKIYRARFVMFYLEIT